MGDVPGNVNRTLEAALIYAKRGWSVLPLVPNKKTPLVKNGFKDASTDESVIRGWFAEWPNANLGIRTGIESGISVVDIDGEAGEESLSKLSLPDTRLHTTPHGRHYIYKYDPEFKHGQGLMPGVDIRSDGGYIVAPPSVIDDVVYKVHNKSPITDIGLVPTQLTKALVPTAPTAPTDTLQMFRDHNAYLEEQTGGWHLVICPWSSEHSNPEDNTAKVSNDAFKCFHKHCDGRKIGDVRTLWRERGPGPIRLSDHIPSNESRWLLEPLIARHGCTILFGQGGLGKSMFALAELVQLSGKAVIPGVDPVTPINSLYLDWEDNADVQAERLSKLSGDGANVFYMQCPRPIKDMTADILEWIHDLGIVLLLIDSAVMACGGAAETSDGAVRFFEALRIINIPTLAIAHQTKESKQPYPYGSIYWHNSARMTWEMDGDSENEHVITLTNRKYNHGSRIEPLSFRFDYSGENINIEALAIGDARRYLDTDGIWSGIMTFLKNNPSSTTAEISSYTGRDYDTVKKTLQRDRGRNFIHTDTKVYKWSIKAKGTHGDTYGDTFPPFGKLRGQ